MRLDPSSIALVLVTLVMSVTVGCQSDDLPLEPDDPPSCAVSLALTDRVEGVYSAYLNLSLGDGWSDDLSIEWEVLGPGPGSIAVVGGAPGRIRARLDAIGPGNYTITAALDDGSAGPCHSTAVASSTIDLESILGDCDVALERIDTPALDMPVEFRLRLGAAWSESTPATWRVSGPADAALSVLDSVGVVRRARATFSLAGAYDVSVALAASPDSSCAADSASIAVAIPSGLPECDVYLYADESTVVGERATYQLAAGNTWGEDMTVEWFFEGPAEVTTIPGEPHWRFHPIDAIFSRPGRYRVGARVVAATESPCGAIEESIFVIVEPGDCGVATRSRTSTHVGWINRFSATPGDGWAFDHANERVDVNWTLVSGDPAAAVVLRDDDSYGVSNFDVRFDVAGTYEIEASLDDLEVPDGFACPRWVERFEIEVVGPPMEPLPLGLVALASPATGPVTSVGGNENGAVVAGTSAAVVIATERGTDAVDLVTGDRLEAVQRLASSQIPDPPNHSLVMIYSLRVALFESTRTGGGYYHWSGEAWSTLRNDRSFLVDVRDIQVPESESWSNVLGRRAGPIPCRSYHNGIVTTSYGEVVELSTDVCNGEAFDSWVVRFDVSQTESPRAELVGSAKFGGTRTGVLVVTDGTPGRVYVAEGANTSIVYQDLGPVGDAPRMVRTSGAIGVVVNRDSDDVTLISYASGGASIIGEYPVGPKPTSVALRQRPGGGVVALTTSGVDKSVTLLVIDTVGNVVSSAEQELPSGWKGELDGIWMPDDDMTYVVSCVGRPELFVGRFD